MQEVEQVYPEKALNYAIEKIARKMMINEVVMNKLLSKEKYKDTIPFKDEMNIEQLSWK